EQQRVPLTQSQLERLGEADDQGPSWRGTAVLDEAQVPLGGSGAKSELELAPPSRLPPAAQLAREAIGRHGGIHVIPWQESPGKIAPATLAGMKSYHVEYGGGLSSLSVREHPQPEPRLGEALVRVRANSLNGRELSILGGRYPLPVKPDVVPVSDGAGEVVAVGPGVTRVKVGDRVAASIFPRWIDGPFGVEQAPQLGGSPDGMLTEYAALAGGALRPL